MDKKELMDYLKDAYQLETQLYTLNCLKEKYENAYVELKVKQNEPLYIEEDFDGTNNEDFRNPICRHIFDERDEYSYDGYENLNEFLHENEIFRIRKSWKTAEYDRLNKAYEEERKAKKSFLNKLFGSNSSNNSFSNLYEYLENMYKKDMSTKSNWYQEKMNVISTELTEIISKKILETENILEKLYSNNFIHSKYRSLIATGQIYEYLETGRCNELEGPNGAYNLFENELRQNIIILQLDEISMQLDNLNRTMYYVATAINKSNMLLGSISSQLGQMSSSLSLIESNTALTAYNTQCTAFNTELMRRYN